MDVKKKNKLYENQQIGNFNVLMGYTLGEAGYRRPFSINTFQQVYRHDKVVGDLFAHVGGKYFILEFKKSYDDCKSELLKSTCQRLISELMNNSNQQITSGKGHFLCYGDVHASTDGLDQLDYHLIPYHLLHKALLKEEFTRFDVRDFTLSLIGKSESNVPFQVGMTHPELVDYMKLLKECAGEDSYDASGIVACFDEKRGMVSVPFQNLEELSLLLEQSNSIEKTQKQEKSRSRGFWKSKNKDRGMGMG